VQLRRKAHNLASQKKSQEWQTMLSRLESQFISDCNHFFSEIVKIRRKRTTSPHSLSSIREDGGPIKNDPDEIKRLLFDLHSRMGKQDAHTDIFDKPHYFEITSLVASISGTEKGPAFCEEVISLDEIDAALAEAQSHKACGLDQIANEPLKFGAEQLSPALHTVFNVLLKTGICPSIWAKALVHLIF
jgi:hypothetical protein